jgi:DNA-directed RNA polymerase sigma subunit (sigma70/sigma32)
MTRKKDIVAKAYAERDKEIVRLHKAKWSLREIGQMFDLSYERVRQILDKQSVKGVK